MPTTKEACHAAALSFTQHLAERAYAEAYAMTSQGYREAISLENLQEEFEEIVPLDFGDIGPIEIVQTLESWPAKQDSDLVWIYVSIGGDVYSEGLVVVLADEAGEPRVRDVEFGRP